MRDLNKVLQELQTLQAEYKGKAMPTEVGTQFSALAAEAKAMQDEADRARTVAAVEASARTVESVELPSEAKAAREEGFVAKMTLGDFAAASNELKQFIDMGMPATQWKLVDADIRGAKGTPMVALKRDVARLSSRSRRPRSGPA
jgi:hypothetical protein